MSMIKTEDAVKIGVDIYLCEAHKNRRLLRVKRINQQIELTDRQHCCSEWGCFTIASWLLNTVLDAAEANPAYDQA